MEEIDQRELLDIQTIQMTAGGGRSIGPLPFSRLQTF